MILVIFTAGVLVGICAMVVVAFRAGPTAKFFEAVPDGRISAMKWAYTTVIRRGIDVPAAGRDPQQEN